MKILTIIVALLSLSISLYAFKLKDFAEAIDSAIEEIQEDVVVNGDEPDQQQTSSRKAATSVSPEQQQQQLKALQAEEEAKKIAEVQAKQKAEEQEVAEEQFQSVKKYLLGLPSKASELQEKAAKQDQLSFKGFYARMPIQNACDLVNYYMFKDTPEGFDLQGVNEARYYGVVDETVGDYLRKNFDGSVSVREKSSDYQGIVMFLSVSTDLGKRLGGYYTPLKKMDYPPLGYNLSHVVENGKGEKQNELTSLILSGDLVDKIWGVESLSGEKFAQLFVENYFSKNLGSAWSSLVDETSESVYNEITEEYNDIYVWENTRDGYLLKLSTSDKSILLQSIRKESSISFD